MQTDLTPVKKLLNSKYTAIAILLIISIGVYLNTLPNEFVYDDEEQVLRNLWIKDAKHIPEIFLSNAWASEGKELRSNYYRPIMNIIYMIDYQIFGFRPWGFHLTNIFFHGGVSVLLFLMLSLLINQSQDLNFKSQIPNSKSKTQNPKYQILSAPFIAAFLFAAHPIHTEAVTWVGGIPELSFTLFYLLSFYLYIYPVRDKSLNRIKVNGKWGKRIVLSAIFFFLATLCKEPALTLPLLLLVYDYSFGKDTLLPLSSKTLYQLLKRYFPYLIVSIIYFILRTYALGGFAPLAKRHAQLSNYEYFINVFPLFTQYLEKLILPINMSAFYVFHPISSIFQLKGIITLILTLGFVFLVYIFRRRKVVFLSLLWIVIPLLPVLYIPALGESTFSDRYLYLPSIGFVILISTAMERIYSLKILERSANYVIISILIILTGLYSVGTIKRNYIWRDAYSLWTDTVEKSPDSPPAHNNLGIVYSKQGRFDEAIKEYITAIKLNPDSPEPHNDLGNIYSKLDRFDEAVKEYTIALKLKPNHAEAHNNIGNAYAIQGKLDEAIKEYLIVLKLTPEDAETHNNLANAYSEMRELNKAIEHYQIALRLIPDYPDAHYNLGLVYLEKGLSQKADEEFKTALKLRPDFTPAKKALESINRER